MIETDVLIIGSGPAGAAAAALLSTYEVRNIVATKFNWTCRTPRAHITNQRTMEVLRDLGIEDEVMKEAAPQHIMGNNFLLHVARRRGAGAALLLGHQPAAPGRLHGVEPDHALRHAAEPDGADPRGRGRAAGLDGLLQLGIPLARAGCRRRHGAG
jgi:NADPH-dependent 2,4-dienoyl-CoA reductase/sulfur reductase-like enzyme